MGVRKNKKRSREDSHISLQAVLLDLDGTLIDTASDMTYTLNQLLVEDNHPTVAEETVRGHISGGVAELIALGYGESYGTNAKEELCRRFLQEYSEHILDCGRATSSQLFAGMEQLLQAIESRQIPWGIVTNKPRHLSMPLTHQLELDNRLAVLVCPEDVQRVKPDPEALLMAVRTLGCEPSACIYAGDHRRDIEAGRAAGMTTVAVRYGFIAADDSADAWGADVVVDTPQELLEWLDRSQWSVPMLAS